MIDLNEILYDFQREDADIMVEDPKKINGSEMGVGKTEVAIKAMIDIGGKRNLIVAPNSMTLEWRDRLQKYGEEDVILPYTSNGYRLDTQHFNHKYLVVNHEMLRLVNKRKKKRVQSDYLAVLEIPPWDCIIVDEAHRFKSPDAQQTMGLSRLARRVERIHPTSGTLFTNYPNELHPILDMLHPGEYGSYWEFAREYCVVLKSVYGPRIVGVRKKRLPELRQIMSEVMIRREKKDVLPHLPPKTYRPIPLSLNPTVRKAYDELEEELFTLLESGESIHAKNAISLLTKLRQLSLDPALLGVHERSIITDVTSELVEDLTKAGKKVVVFSWFSSYLDVLRQKIGGELISGNVKSEEDRRAARLRFQEGDSNLILCSIETAVGYDLTASDVCIFTDRYWVPMKNIQAEDRLHREGQNGNVLVICLEAENSIYQDINKVTDKKENAFNETIALQRMADSLLARRKS